MPIKKKNITREAVDKKALDTYDKLQNRYPEPTEEEKEDESIPGKLNPKQELFCQLYTRHGDTYGSGVKSYALAYGIEIDKYEDYKVAQAAASRLLSNVIIYTKINKYLENDVLNDAVVDAQLAYLIAQHEDKSSKVSAIREYNKLKQRIVDKIEHSGSISSAVTWSEIKAKKPIL